MALTLKEEQQIELLMAQAINGPYYDPPEHSGYTLKGLREYKWTAQTGHQCKAKRISQARSVIRLLRKMGINIEALKHAIP